MASPFPGMDPFLEGSLWISVHTQLSVEIARPLNPKLRPRYVALTPRRGIQPGKGTEPAPLLVATEIPEPIPHVSVEIRDVQHRQLVTSIELLSPTNKLGAGRDEYLTRRNRVLQSSTHLIEIDLLRAGQRVPARQPLPPAPYFVFLSTWGPRNGPQPPNARSRPGKPGTALDEAIRSQALSRAQTRPLMEVWPIAIEQPLPTVPVPLLDGDPDVALALQEALTQVYEDGSYGLLIDYAGSPEVPLSDELAAWVQRRLSG